jgi:hypothetical protein
MQGAGPRQETTTRQKPIVDALLSKTETVAATTLRSDKKKQRRTAVLAKGLTF